MTFWSIKVKSEFFNLSINKIPKTQNSIVVDSSVYITYVAVSHLIYNSRCVYSVQCAINANGHLLPPPVEHKPNGHCRRCIGWVG